MTKEDANDGARDRVRAQYESPMYRALLEVWGDNIHPGLFSDPNEPLATASQRANARLAQAAKLRPGDRVIETACGIGGAAQYIAGCFGVTVTATNVSEAQLSIGRERAAAHGLADSISFEFADFEALPHPPDAFDCYWCQDSWLYAKDKPKVIQEAYRVLRPGGRLVVSDLVLRPAAAPESDRIRFVEGIGAPLMWSAEPYPDALASAGFETVTQEDWSNHVALSFEKAHDGIAEKRDVMAAIAGYEAVDETAARFALWVEACRSGLCGWAFFTAVKPEQESPRSNG